jgi:hypothetical protein
MIPAGDSGQRRRVVRLRVQQDATRHPGERARDAEVVSRGDMQLAVGEMT